MLNPIRLIYRPFKDSDDKIFALLLVNEFSKDLESATFLSAIPEDERNPTERFLIGILQQRYTEKNRLRKHVSKNLREEYDRIHSEICQVLYI